MSIKEWQQNEKDELTKIKEKFGIKLKDIVLTDNFDINEIMLQNYCYEIRSRWLHDVCLVSAQFCGSPWRGLQPCDMEGHDVKYTYGTLVDDSKVAHNLEGYSVENRNSHTYLYNNGMAAIKGTVEIVNSFIKAPLIIQSFLGYFETRIYLETLKNCGIIVNEKTENANMFIFEPIQYFMNLPITNLEKVIDAINQSKAKEKFVVVDSTMDCSTKLLNYIQSKLTNIFNVIFVEIRSGVKQDQCGLEISNFGVATWHVSSCNRYYSEMLFKYIKKYKDISGENISYEKLLAISFFSFENSIKYKAQLQNNVEAFMNAISISNNRYITKVLSPKIQYDDVVCAIPFVFVKFNLQKKSSYEVLLDNIIKYCEKRGCNLPYRNSFGFRYPSIEFICDYKTKELVIKFGLGVYQGLVFEKIVELINVLGDAKNKNLCEELIQGVEEWKND